MPLLTMILTIPLLYISYEKNHESETFYLGKLFLLWFLCQLYISINYKLKIPIGMIIGITLVYKEKVNKRSKLMALIIGCISFLTSNLVYLLYKG